MTRTPLIWSVSLVLCSLVAIAGCDADAPPRAQAQDGTPSLDRVLELHAETSDLTAEALRISRQGVPIERSYSVAYAAHFGEDVEAFERAFDESFAAAQKLRLAEPNVGLHAQKSVGVDRIIEGFAYQLYPEMPASLVRPLADAAYARADAQLSPAEANDAKQGVALVFYVHLLLNDYGHEILTGQFSSSGGIGAADMWTGWSVEMTQRRDYPAPNDPPRWSEHFNGYNAVLTVIGTAGAFGGGAGAFGTFVGGPPVGFAAGAIGVGAGIIVGARLATGGADHEYQIALDRWCGDPVNRGHMEYRDLCE